MLTTQTAELLQHLRVGLLDPADTAHLEQVKADDLLADVAAQYPVRFQERRLSAKWEVGVARSLRFELKVRFFHGSPFPTSILFPILRRCLMLSGEAETVTGISASHHIIVRPIRKPFRGLALLSVRGFKIDKLPDGWNGKPLVTKTVELTEDFLRHRVWQFDLCRP